MVSIKFNIQLLLVIALLILQQEQTSANALFGKLRRKEFTYMQKDHDSTDGIIASAGGIRKLLVYQFSSKVVKQEDMADDVSVKGDAGFDSMKSSHMNVQVDSQILHERSKKRKSKEFGDVEDEIAKLMGKDYSGQSRPHRSKPPINNHEPMD